MVVLRMFPVVRFTAIFVAPLVMQALQLLLAVQRMFVLVVIPKVLVVDTLVLFVLVVYHTVFLMHPLTVMVARTVTLVVDAIQDLINLCKWQCRGPLLSLGRDFLGMLSMRCHELAGQAMALWRVAYLKMRSKLIIITRA